MNRDQVEQYLERIGLKGPLDPTADVLCRLQVAHLKAVPYENMDILLHREMPLDEASLFEKIVTRRRGGYCFELNGLFGMLLRALGYGVTDCFARFLQGESTIPMRRHRVLIVRTVSGERYIADVGVGVSIPREPLRLEEGVQGQYEIRKHPFFGWTLYDRDRVLYAFTEEPQLTIDFEAAHLWCQVSPASPFTAAPMIAIRTDRGRITMDGDILRFHEPEGVAEAACPEGPEQTEALRRYFGIVV